MQKGLQSAILLKIMLPTPLRRTKIICTIGPSCWDQKTLYSLADNGMNVARLNFSHGDLSLHQKVIAMIRAYNDSHPLNVAMMLDTKGAEIRSGDVKEPIQISKDEEIIFTSRKKPDETRKVVEVGYDKFAKDVLETGVILLDNGELSFDIVRVDKNGEVTARAREDGKIGSRRHINLPGADLDMPSITEKDWKDIEFGARENLDFLALSFIREEDEVHAVRKLLRKLNSKSQIVSKIETRNAVENIASIIDASDAIMVARGDLGAEVPFERLPLIQDEIVCRCKDAGKPVIIATHMLESMCVHPIPTRAEVMDTSHAVATGADTSMLSGETASGGRPLEALRAMDKIERAMEAHMAKLETVYEIRFKSKEEEEMNVAVSLAEKCNIDAFVVITESGKTARYISKFRPKVPIIALTPNAAVQRSLLLCYGIYPIVVPFESSDDDTMSAGIELSKNIGLLQKDQRAILLKNKAKSPKVITI